MIRLLLAFAVATFLVPSTPQASTLLDNLGTAGSNGTRFGVGLGTNFPKFAGWSMPGPSYELHSVQLQLSEVTSETTPLVRLLEGSSSASGTLMATLTNPVFTTDGLYDFIPASTTVLSAGSTYWLSVSASSIDAPLFQWDAGSTDPTGLLTFKGYFLGPSESSFSNVFAVNGKPVSAIPLPAAGWLLLGGLGLMATFSLRRRKAAA